MLDETHIRLVHERGRLEGVLSTLAAQERSGTASEMLVSARLTDARAVQTIAIDPVTGAVRVVSTLGADFNFATPDAVGLRFTLAPDGLSFLGTVMRMRTDLWILEDFAPRDGIRDWFRRGGHGA